MSSEKIQLLIAEYTALKTEQSYRLSVRDNNVVLSVTFVVGLFGVFFGSDIGSNYKIALILVVPYATAVAFWIYVTNDYFISKIRDYILAHLKPELIKAIGGSGESSDLTSSLLYWDEWHRGASAKRGFRKLVRIIMVVLVYVLSSIIATGLSYSLIVPIESFFILGIWLGGLVLSVVSTVVLFLTIDFSKEIA